MRQAVRPARARLAVPAARGQGSAINRDRDAGDEAGIVGGEERDDIGVVARLTETAERENWVRVVQPRICWVCW